MGKDKTDRLRTKESKKYMSSFSVSGKPEHLTEHQYQQRVHKQQNVHWHEDRKPPRPPLPPQLVPLAPPPPPPVPPPPQLSQLNDGSAIIAILAHGSLQINIDGTISNDIDVPAKITRFAKKNVSAPGYYSILDLYYRRSVVDIIRGIILYGLDASFPTIEDVRKERLYQQKTSHYHSMLNSITRPPGYATDWWGNPAVRGKCRTGICQANEERILVNKNYTPEIRRGIRLPIAFYYGKSTKIYDLFKNDDLIELLHAGSTAENAEEIIAIIRTLMPPGEEEEYTSKLTTDIILKIAELIGITNLLILDFSCSSSEDSGYYDKQTLIVQPPGVKYGGRPKSMRKNKKYKTRKTRKTKNI
jgi:hypothetical protein